MLIRDRDMGEVYASGIQDTWGDLLQGRFLKKKLRKEPSEKVSVPRLTDKEQPQ